MALSTADTCQTVSFEEWLRGVNIAVGRLCGLSLSDLPDICTRDAYDNEVSIKEFVRDGVRDLLAEEGLVL